ncbi:MAG: 50S ribosomal protein L4 [Saprospiraceae bacterium]|jgi:large subunit ribosomal protein L4|nr:50S ribosomal protein L4 [Saprospiraceae bacterium]MBK7797085.1 50S ribosomal protein L4 [Saprospiraceae bacterium]MBK9377433.1 50S ribosomal protein L4 [Saprospiraceae bacterium]MBL0259525.1 50S ribosomal protein L4 [Saprospiraceae bacterium]MBX7164595.1 50S ribosomal protein L4 [Saprospiraceae bacterium]
MQLEVLNLNGTSTGRSVNLPEAIFGVEPNEHVLYLAVKEYLANQRQGTHDSKERNEVARSTRKIKRQKGTGGARAGSLKNPMFKGGGRIFGPHPRDYSQKLNKKVKALARISALSQLASANNIIVIEDLKFNEPKTKDFSSIVKSLKLDDMKSLFVTPEYNENAYLSSRNIPGSSIQVAKDLNTYELLNTKKLVLTESSVEKLISTLS